MANQENTTPPLWRLIRMARWQAFHPGNAFLSALNGPDPETAAELRAVADAFASRFPDSEMLISPEDVADWLHVEADRAEAGE